MDTKAKILDIAMNLNRIGNWAADGYEEKKRRIDIFLNQTNEYISSLSPHSFQGSFQVTFNGFLKEYEKLTKENIKSEDYLTWAEKMMTWGNILTHRSKLLDKSAT